ncbi:MAG: ribonuclease Z [Methanoregula sp. PtaU1.Bin051]|nr:MAG: ribonuclease Z [Methanoregula sp. PtaU1.Bin051]
MLVEGQGGSILIDAGLSAREILRRVTGTGGAPETIQAILVTHEHGDHITGVDVLSRRLNIPVFATGGTLKEFITYRRSSERPVTAVTCRYHEKFSLGDFVIEPFATSHDAAEPCGFTVRENDVMLGICTDTGIITDRIVQTLSQCDGIVLESNHCPMMLKEGPYPESLKRRIRSARGHLSNDAAADCLRRLGQDVHNIVLAHLSEVNNTPDKAVASARSGLGLLYNGMTVIVASQHGTSVDRPQVMHL